MSTPQASPARRAGPYPLLERADQFATLEAHLASVLTSGRGRLIFIGGEAGVGKSALARRFCGDSAGSARILIGVCDPLFTPRPLGPFLDIASTIGGEFAALAERGARAYEIAAALARALSSGPPTIFLIEDAQWADEATLDALHFLARRIGTVGALMLVTYRDDLARGHPLRILLGELAPDETIARLRLAPLSLDAVATLAEPKGIDAAELYRKTAGNPFFVTEALAAGDIAIPPTVRDAVLARAARLPQGALALLEAVAIVPQATELWLLEQLMGETLEGMDACLAAGILSPADGAVRFRHELARLAIEESITPVRRLALHRRALRALEAPPSGEPGDVRLAHHAEAAADTDAILRYAPAAAERAVVLGAHREAVAQYVRALKVASGLPPAQRAQLLASHAQECYLADDFPSTVASGWEAVTLFRQAGDSLREGRTLRELSHHMRCTGQALQAEEVGRSAVALLEQLPPGRELALAYANLASLRLNADDADGARVFGQRAAAFAQTLADADAEAEVHTRNTLGTLDLLGGASVGLAEIQRSLDLALSAGLEEHVGRAYVNHGWAATRSRSYTGYDQWLAAGRQYCEERGLVLWEHYVVAYAARAALDRGRWSEATELAQRVLRDPRTQLPRINALVTLALIRARRGDPECWAPLDEALALAEPTGELQHLAPVIAARAEVAWLEGRPNIMLEATDAALAWAVQCRASWVIGELACWRWRAGAESLTADAAAPYTHEIAGDWEAATRMWEARDCPYEAALARMGASEEVPLREALTILRRLGAHATARIVMRRLREFGARDLPRGPRASTRANEAHLTTRELDVLALVAEGLRNADIAAGLTLSPKTVDHHLSAILAKLGVRSRAQAIAQAHALHLLPAGAPVEASR